MKCTAIKEGEMYQTFILRKIGQQFVVDKDFISMDTEAHCHKII